MEAPPRRDQGRRSMPAETGVEVRRFIIAVVPARGRHDR
jgi:hypothetical protein